MYIRKGLLRSLHTKDKPQHYLELVYLVTALVPSETACLAWMLGKTPPLAMVTLAKNLFNSASFLIANTWKFQSCKAS